MRHLAKLSLRNATLPEPDMLGRAYEYLIEKFADDAGKKGGEFYTPRKVVQLIVELLQPKEGMRISDPTCGSGGMLIECAKYVERHGGDPRKLSLHGQENKDVERYARVVSVYEIERNLIWTSCFPTLEPRSPSPSPPYCCGNLPDPPRR